MSAPSLPDRPRPRWSLPSRLGFRLGFVYAVFYYFDTIGWGLPEYPAGKYSAKVWEALGTWIAGLVGLEVYTGPNGSGDTTFDYLLIPIMLGVATLVTLIWSVVDRRRPDYQRLASGLRVFLRYSLAVVMFSYGFAKVFKTQFPAPYTDRLDQPFGEASPMGLLWTFMGASEPYNIFTGGAEVLGGLLLIWRRTTTAGALVIIAVMANVVMLNFCYDVPVKLYSVHLLATAIVLLVPDLRRLANVLVFNRAAEPAPERLRLPSRRLERTRWLLKVGFFALTTLVHLGHEELKQRAKYGDEAPVPASAGVFDAKVFVEDGVDRPPLVTDAARWRRVSINGLGGMRIRPMEGPALRFYIEDDPVLHHLLIRSRNVPEAPPQVLRYQRPDNDHLILDGTFEGHVVHAELTRVPTSSYLLTSRGFHWINEVPFNR